MSPAYSHLLPMYVVRIFVFFPTMLHMAWSAVVSLPQRNLTASFQANGNQCTDNPAWIGTGSTSIDCIGAVQKLYNSEVKTFSDIDFEFLSQKAPPRSLPSMPTPRKYAHGKCTKVLYQS